MKDSNARFFMEKAIDVMHNSILERRDDGKASPRVGAVLVEEFEGPPSHADVMTAYRGELREGDHAEFTLLERKNRDRDLSNCVLFATLEPCAPDSRNFPKLGCAERIVLARIKKVWIGIEDPDPKVDRKGISYLQKCGVEVHMFDRDLQEIIRKENKEFIEQALERAAAEAAREFREVSLSSLEGADANLQFEDCSLKALEAYRVLGQFAEPIESIEFKCRLVRQGLFRRVDNRFVPSGFGVLLFAKEPRLSMPQVGMLATIHYADGTEEVETFEGPQVFVPSLVLKWLEDKLPNVIDRSHALRRETRQPFFELIREGVVNALVHRDYDINGAKCQLKVWPDKLEIHSPGSPVAPITIEQLQSLDAPMLSRNPVLHYVFAKMDMAEERGLGLKSMREKAATAGLPLPRYTWNDPYLVLTVYPSVAGATSTLPPEVLSQLNDSEREGWQWLSTQGTASASQYAEVRKLDRRTGRRHLQRFVELGLVRVLGAGRSTRYEVI